MTNNISFNLDFTLSKIMAIAILFVGFASSTYLKDSTIMVTTLGIVAAIITNKQYQDRKKTSTTK